MAAARPSKWKGSLDAACRDCYLTLLVLQRREPGGLAKTYAAYWDDITAGRLPADLKRILDEVQQVSFAPATTP